ncbi:MAG: hypothetical protein RLY70_4742 [Planctomycetota bacterium]|jgi:hypothetical protein
MEKRSRIASVGAALEEFLAMPAPSLGIDIDGCVDEAPIFFKILARVWPGKVFVVSFRSDRAKAESDLQHWGICYDELILVSKLSEKAAVIEREGISVYFDDQPECLQDVDSMRNVMLVRNGGNFDFDDRKWMFSDQTGKRV